MQFNENVAVFIRQSVQVGRIRRRVRIIANNYYNRMISITSLPMFSTKPMVVNGIKYLLVSKINEIIF
jgi:hypothetical protein